MRLHPCRDFGANAWAGRRRLPVTSRGLREEHGGDLLAQNIGIAQPVAASLCALEVELRIVFCGEAYAAVQLDRFLCAEEERLEPSALAIAASRQNTSGC